MARRALEIAAAGGHNTLMIGPPGSGKTMMARRLGGIMPALDLRRSAGGDVDSFGRRSRAAPAPAWCRRGPFRAPHHTISDVALVGGGTNPRPGEISLAHHGVLFLDEMPEFSRHVLEVLRQPIEEGCVPDRPRGAHRELSCAVHADRRDEPVPVRVLRRRRPRLPMHAAADRALWRAALGSAPRPPRPDRAGRRDARARACRRRRRRTVGVIRQRVVSARGAATGSAAC